MNSDNIKAIACGCAAAALIAVLAAFGLSTPNATDGRVALIAATVLTGVLAAAATYVIDAWKNGEHR